MRYSFIRPRRKPIFNLFTRLWIFFSFFSLLVILSAYALTSYKVISIKYHIKAEKKAYTKMQDKISSSKDLIEEYKSQALNANEIVKSNNTLNISIRNLFKLVPASIVFSELKMYKKELTIKGATPTKEAFITLLETPLKSIFVRSNTMFFPLENGWYDFVSKNEAYGPGDKR